MEIIKGGIYITRPPRNPMQEYPFGLKFYERCVGAVLCLGWVQIGLVLFSWNSKSVRQILEEIHEKYECTKVA